MEKADLCRGLKQHSLGWEVTRDPRAACLACLGGASLAPAKSGDAARHERGRRLIDRLGTKSGENKTLKHSIVDPLPPGLCTTATI